MAQMKEQIKTPEKELNEMEISNLSDVEFKTVVIMMLSCILSRPGRFTQDSGRQMKMCGAIGVADMPLFLGG